MAEPIAEVGYEAGICGHDGTDWEKILIDASKRLVVAVASIVASDVHSHGYYDGAWQKQPLIWSYNDRYQDDATVTSAAGDNVLDLTAISPGEVVHVEYISYQHTDAVARKVQGVGRTEDGDYCYIFENASAGAGAVYGVAVGVTLKEGDFFRFIFRSMNADKTLNVWAWGYKMELDL